MHPLSVKMRLYQVIFLTPFDPNIHLLNLENRQCTLDLLSSDICESELGKNDGVSKYSCP